MSLFDRPEEETVPECRDRTCLQCVRIEQPVTVTPTSEIGTASVCYQGAPAVLCERDPAGTRCRLTVTQNICLSIPVRFGVEVSAEDPSIDCAGGCGQEPCPDAG